MKIKNLMLLASLSVTIIIMSSCRKANDTGQRFHYVKNPVTKVEGPREGLINQDIDLSIFFNVLMVAHNSKNLKQLNQLQIQPT